MSSTLSSQFFFFFLFVSLRLLFLIFFSLFHLQNREVVERFPTLRQSIIVKFLESFTEIKDGGVFRGALWIVGDYCLEIETIDQAFSIIRSIIGEVPIVASEIVRIPQFAFYLPSWTCFSPCFLLLLLIFLLFFSSS